MPTTEQEWREIAENYAQRWNFPNCISAFDGKHILIKPPGESYHNYKHTFSIVLLALVDADYKFIYVDIGTNGRVSDGGVLKQSTLGKALENSELSIPQPSPLQRYGVPMPYVIVADDAFPLKENIMKPYSLAGLTKEQRIFNYRLSRARRIIENAFGILSNRFRIFMTPMALKPEKAEVIVMAACTLHNYLRAKVKLAIFIFHKKCWTLKILRLTKFVQDNGGNKLQRDGLN